MVNSILLPCDGCGQAAYPEHITRRLQRLERATRFRPVHVQTLLLGGVSPRSDDEYLYSPEQTITGEARAIVDAAQISTEGRPKDAVLTEIQKLGLLLTHVLECPLDGAPSELETRALMQKHLSATVARIRRSLKPKHVILLSPQLRQFADELRRTDLGCLVHPAPMGTFLPSKVPDELEIRAFRMALGGSSA